MADLLPIAIFIKDADSKLLLVNKVCEEQWGMSQSDLSGTDGSQFFPSDQMLLFFAKDKEVFAGKCQVDFEETFPEFADHLQSIQTGTKCQYKPAPDLFWEVSPKK